MRFKLTLILATALLATFPALAQESDADIGYRGWGLRLGVSSDPDQILGGFQFDFGEFTPQLRFQPDLQVGFGDDATTLYATFPVHYRFKVDQEFTPYAGGGVALGLVDVDLPPMASGDETSFEIGARATGGLEWARGGGKSFAVELSLGFGDVHDAQVLAVWNFGR